MDRLLRVVVALLAAAALASCSSATMTRLAYSNAALAYSNFGPALAWTVDDYVDMNDAQEAWVKERATRLMQWHRKEELPRARRILEGMLAKADGAFSTEELAVLQADARGFYLRFMGRLAPDMAEFLATTDAGQLGRIENKLAKDNREFLKESVHGTPEERRRRRMHRFLTHLEAWTGPLDDAQREVIASAYAEVPDLTEQMLGERRYRQAEVLALVRSNASKQEMEPTLRRLFVGTDEWRRPEYARAVRERDALLQEAVAKVSGTLTAKQRAALQARIRGLIADIDKVTAAS
ncbi:MAG TPA: DUF6279 family lipoprotein [Usitatibacter sp.]|nr:DUF6279 family lipoprotein [Usitatibacter sp.]